MFPNTIRSITFAFYIYHMNLCSFTSLSSITKALGGGGGEGRRERITTCVGYFLFVYFKIKPRLNILGITVAAAVNDLFTFVTK